ncbi:MAG: enoyl-CoA hydratase-related protein [Spongiibacteraceae bacterium]
MNNTAEQQQAPVVLEALHNRVLTVTLNRPEAKNAINLDVVPLLNQILQRAEHNPEVGAIVLTGAGNTFSVGGDVKSMAAKTEFSEEELLGALHRSSATVLKLHRMNKPTIAFIRGPAAGGGLALALGCDLRYGDETARLTYAYTKIALPGDFAANWLLEKLLGTAQAREFCFFSPVVGAAEAKQLGLLNRVFPAVDAQAQVQALAEQLANGPTATLAEIKANLNAAAELPAEQAVAREAESFVRCRLLSDHREASIAFVEKRAPRFNQGGN